MKIEEFKYGKRCFYKNKRYKMQYAVGPSVWISSVFRTSGTTNFYSTTQVKDIENIIILSMNCPEYLNYV